MNSVRANDDEAGSAGSVPDESKIADVETAGETTAAATGPAEIGAATVETTGEGDGADRGVSADTMVKVADTTD